MSLQDYLNAIAKKAQEEKEVLDELAHKNEWDKIELRAAKNSMQVLIEALIGKSKRVLKHYNCPVIPQRSKDAIYILYEVGAIDDEEYRTFSAAIGFRNVLIHDYLEFDDNILLRLIKNREYEPIYRFLTQPLKLSNVVIKRIENFTL
jgi:uncharacterized protein YutE (UPF0331/DUF86 family)